MKTQKTVTTAIVSIAAALSIIGLIIAFGKVPNAPILRLFVDLAGIIAMISVCLTVIKPAQKLNTEHIVDGLRDVARGRYQTRLNDTQLPELNEIVQAFNELAGTLSDRHDVHKEIEKKHKQAEQSLRDLGVYSANHSFHPEIGQVQVVEKANKAPKAIVETKEQVAEDLPASTPDDTLIEAKLAPEPVDDIILLYNDFVAEQRKYDIKSVSFESFKSTIENARDDLLAAHVCKAVMFDVVANDGKVALQPRLVR